MSAKGIIRFLIARIFEVLVIILLILFMPSLPPQAKFETPYKLPQTLPFEGKLALNEKLNNVEIWHKSDLIGPEAFAVYDNQLYTSIHGGDVVKLAGNHITPVVKFGKPCKGLYEEKICGRPLGLDFDKDGTLYAADAYYGIFKVNIKTGDKVQLVSPEDEIDGKVPKIFNSVKLASNGDLYWSDSSTEFDLQDGLFDMFADGSGRLIHYNAKTKQNTVLIKDIHFANGVNLANDESFVLVNEIGRNRIRRYYLKGPKKGTHDFFIEGLPGLPDNLISDGQGGFLVPLVLAVDDEHPLVPQILGPFPLARKFVARVFGLFEVSFRFWDRVYPNEYAQRAVHFVGHFQSFTGLISPKRVTILRISKTGEIIDSLHGLNGRISGISDATIFKDTLYLGSPFNDYIARIPLSDIGWEALAQKPAKKSPEKQTTQSPPPVKQTTPPVTQAPPTKQTPTTSAPVVTKEAPKVQKEPPTTKAPPKPTTQSPPSNNIPKSDSRPGKDSQKPVKDIPK